MLLPTAEAARRIGVRDELLVAWENGEGGPTLPQLRKAAAVYQQPLSAFLLTAPPAIPQAVVAFRTLPREQGESPSREFVSGLRRANNQQAITRYLAELEGNPLSSLEFRLDLSMDPEQAGAALRDWMEVTLDDQLAWSTTDEAFRNWVTAIENKNILVIHVAGVPLTEMRAFAERTRPFPVIALNGKDSTTGKTFSLLHELVHVLLDTPDTPAIHVLHSIPRKTEPDTRVELFCNRVAGAALIPGRDLERQPGVASATRSTTWSDSQIRALSSRYKVSREALLIRLVSLGKASQSFYLTKRQQFEQEYAEFAQRQKEKGGGNYYRQRVRDLGRRFVRTVLSAYAQDAISSRDVTTYLGVQLGKLDQIASLVEPL
jgi:Zn-dependent peptidase ImmA (M78 family)